MPADKDACRNLVAVINELFPSERSFGRRILTRSEGTGLKFNVLERAIAEIASPAADTLVGAREVRALIDEIARHAHAEPERSLRLRQVVVEHVLRRWGALAERLARLALDNVYSTSLYQAFPALRSDPAIVRALASRLADDDSFFLNSACGVLAEIEICSVDQARILIVAAMKRQRRSRSSNNPENEALFTILFATFGRRIGWTPWVKLFGLIVAVKAYADPFADVRVAVDPSREAREVIDARRDLSRELGGDAASRAIAARLLDLLDEQQNWSNDGLLSRPAETRAAFVTGLFEAVESDRDMRHAVIEALLWLSDRRTVDLGQFTATRLVTNDDNEFLDELSHHPERLVGYAAGAVKRAVFGTRLECDMSLPRASASMAESLLEIGGLPSRSEEPARTWLGDRMVERLIEHTVASVEARFGGEYEDYGEEGEEKLLPMMFEALSARFEALDLALEATARATSAPRRAHINMRYRTIDKAEEGRKGVNNAKSFSADLCIIVDPVLDGRSLGRRVTLVQVKRLYRDKSAPVEPAWHHSFHLKVDQMKDLIQQTRSAVYFFQGPSLGGRGVPVIPAQLVSDLAAHQGGSGAELARDIVAIASRSLADWFTYDALALRIGDPMQELVKKADGAPGRLPRRLLALPRVEIEIGMSERSAEGRR
jgi:hypothetical protein